MGPALTGKAEIIKSIQKLSLSAEKKFSFEAMPPQENSSVFCQAKPLAPSPEERKLLSLPEGAFLYRVVRKWRETGRELLTTAVRASQFP